MARKAYSMCESGPWLCPSPLCLTGHDNDGQCPLGEIHCRWKLMFYMLHMHTAQLASASKPFWILLNQFVVFDTNRENVSDF